MGSRFSFLALGFVLAACADGGRGRHSTPRLDTGPPLRIDAGPGVDAGPGIDAGRRDAGPLTMDAGPRDAGRRDAGPPDSGPPDSGPPDTGPRDAGRLSGRVLVYYDSGDTVADEAITALGMTPVLTTDGGTFNTELDAGGIDVVILDVPGSALPTGMWMRLSTRIAAGGAVIFNWWDLDTDVSIQSGLGVTVASYDVWRPVYRDPASPTDLFGLRESVPSPINGSDMAGDNGDALTLTGAGFLAARLDSPSGPGAIAVTHGNRVVVNGFLPWDCRTGDGDVDGRIDMVELYMNEIALVTR
jgi:hypothetical protein